jgi:glycosyltransferase involved in cell wall biosynthesis
VNILFISYSDSGGAGSAIYMLHQSLKSIGFNSKLLVVRKTRDDQDIKILKTSKFKHKFFKLLDKVEDNLGIIKKKYAFEDRSRYFINNVDDIKSYIPDKIDVLILGWVSKVADLQVFLDIKKQYHCRVYWLLTDLAPVTGGCHYPYDCKGYEDECACCPALRFPYRKLAHNKLMKKKQILSQMDPVVLNFAPWVNETLNRSALFENSKRILVTGVGGVDNNIYKPADKVPLRIKHGLDKFKKIVLFAADNVLDERKGFVYFSQAMSNLEFNYDDNELALIIIGKNSNKAAEQINNSAVTILAFEYTASEHLLAEYIQLSDLFVSTALSDIGPGMLIYAMLCGVPTVSFNIGIAIDMIEHLKSGYIAQDKSSDDIAAGINYILSLDGIEYSLLRENSLKASLRLYSESARERYFNSLVSDMLNS